MALLGCIAESLAVALEFGAALAGQGVTTALVPGTAEGPLPDADAVIVIAPPDGLAACDALLSAGARQVVQAISADFEPIATGRLADALLRRLQVSFAPIVPADPARGRSVYLGHLFLGTSPAGGEANLPRRLSAGTQEPVGLIPFRVVEAGAGSLRTEISRMAEWGRRYAVLDAVTEAHLAAIGDAVRAQALLIGAAGLAAGIATHFPRTATAPDWPTGPGAVLVGSAGRETLAQAGLARLYAPTFDMRDDTGAEAAVAWAAPLLSDELPVVIAGAVGMTDFGPIARGLIAHGVSRLLVAGEDACEAVMAALGVGVLRIGAMVDDGLPWCAVDDSRVHILLKPGTAGARDIMLRAFASGD